MRILAIETSCDETAIAVLKVTGKRCSVEAHHVASQIALHQQYGGVFPAMAKREHARNIVPLFIATLKDAGLFVSGSSSTRSRIQILPAKKLKRLKSLLIREQDIIEPLIEMVTTIKKPAFDRITVTVGPGLEPALWVGINFAKALSLIWDIPIVPVNHMEGHIFSALVPEQKKSFELRASSLKLPIISLLVSGGHTELVLVKGIGKYKLIGQTRDDAAGEAFDKVARMLELPYPGGPEISRLASQSRDQLGMKNERLGITLPRPMLNTGDFDFSFSGLKTAVLYLIRDMGGIKKISEKTKIEIAREFEDAVCDVLIKKTLSAAKKYKVKNIIVGGGVSANNHLKKTLEQKSKESNIQVMFPTKSLTTDNAIMIGIAGVFGKPVSLASKKLRANGNLQL